MKYLLFLVGVILLLSCKSGLESRLTGKKIEHDIHSDQIHFDINGIKQTIKLPTNDSVDFHNPKWLKEEDIFLMEKVEKNTDCYRNSILSFDIHGEIQDTLFDEKPCQIIDFMPSPNDRLLALRSYNYIDWRDGHLSNCQYLIYNFKDKVIQDSITFETDLRFFDSFTESIWSPDSKKLLIFENKGIDEETYQTMVKGIVFDLNTKDTTYIDTGSNFIWLPHDNKVISFLKNNSIWFKNIYTKEVIEFYKGTKNKPIKDFRFSPKGDILLVNRTGYWFNINTYLTWHPTHLLISTVNKEEQEGFINNLVIDSWK